jgi:hypothetical protein
VVQGWSATCCDSPKSGSNEKTKTPVERCHVIPSVASVEKEKKKGRRQRTSTQRDVEDKVLRSKEFVNVAMSGWVICDGFA